MDERGRWFAGLSRLVSLLALLLMLTNFFPFSCLTSHWHREGLLGDWSDCNYHNRLASPIRLFMFPDTRVSPNLNEFIFLIFILFVFSFMRIRVSEYPDILQPCFSVIITDFSQLRRYPAIWIRVFRVPLYFYIAMKLCLAQAITVFNSKQSEVPMLPSKDHLWKWYSSLLDRLCKVWWCASELRHRIDHDSTNLNSHNIAKIAQHIEIT